MDAHEKQEKRPPRLALGAWNLELVKQNGSASRAGNPAQPRQGEERMGRAVGEKRPKY